MMSDLIKTFITILTKKFTVLTTTFTVRIKTITSFDQKYFTPTKLLSWLIQPGFKVIKIPI